MTVHRTIGAQNVTASCATELDAQAEAVLTKLETIDARDKLRPGMRIRIGWSMFTLLHRDGGLRVCEPDFSRDPLHDIRPGIDTSLHVIKRQAVMLQQVHEEGVDAGFDKWLVASDTTAGAHELFLVRSSPTDDDSGWSITDSAHTASADGAGLSALRVWQLLAIRPHLMAALCLPPGYTVVTAADKFVSILDATDTDRWNASGRAVA